MRARGVFAVVVSVGFASVPAASARVEASSGYTKTQAFNGALRFLRVDRGYDVLEKDAEAAYVMFSYPMPGKQPSTSGSVEVVETEQGTKIYVQLPRLPEYHEVVLRDALLRRLRDDYGAPPAKAKPKPPKADESPKKPAEPSPDEPPKAD